MAAGMPVPSAVEGSVPDPAIVMAGLNLDEVYPLKLTIDNCKLTIFRTPGRFISISILAQVYRLRNIERRTENFEFRSSLFIIRYSDIFLIESISILAQVYLRDLKIS